MSLRLTVVAAVVLVSIVGAKTVLDDVSVSVAEKESLVIIGGSGTGKSGWPIERLIGSGIEAAMSNTLRMPELSKCLVRSAIQEFMGSVFLS